MSIVARRHELFSNRTKSAKPERGSGRFSPHAGATVSRVFTTSRRVEFRDTDAAAIVHFSVFFAYMEQAEHELLRSVGLSVIQEYNGRTISWPRVHAECNYRKPARFEDELEIQVTVARIGEKSVTYQFRFVRGRDAIADGQIVAACCEVEDRHIKTAVSIPAEFAARIQPFVAAN
jgi:4-hydroxybenzoyl-CoA thioesterase/acyl-CoA thioester hydrolase